MRLTALVVALALPAAFAAAAGPSGNVRFCAFSGGQPAVRGELAALALEVPPEALADETSPVPVADKGVLDPAAGAKARALLTEMLSQSPASVAQSLRRQRVFLVIIPRDKKLTDLPQFASLRGVGLPDGRVWDDVRGVGFVSQADGTVAVAAGEENFLSGAAPDRYPKGFLVAHEFSHAVHGFGLSSAEAAVIRKSYQDREAAHLDFPSHYASTDDLEYFAVSASSFFGRRLSGRDPEREIGWIEQHDAPMFGVLGRAYGAPRPLWPDAAATASR